MSDEKPMGQVIQIDEARIREQSGAAPRRAICGGANRSGAGGAKGGDQGECGPAKHAPDAEPGKRVTGAGTHTEGLCRHTPKGGSRMRENRTYGSARGARDETRVPGTRPRRAAPTTLAPGEVHFVQ
jgi:hypothetical protein